MRDNILQNHEEDVFFAVQVICRIWGSFKNRVILPRNFEIFEKISISLNGQYNYPVFKKKITSKASRNHKIIEITFSAFANFTVKK